ncbi:MAG: DUF2125 domain-containing protein [Halocynthiibacter sp.]
MKSPVKAIIVCIVLVLVGWSGFWALGGSGLKTGFQAWFEDRQKDGWVAEHQSMEAGGFPLTNKVTIQAPTLADPKTGIAWSASDITFQSPVYQPQKMQLRFPKTQKFATPRGQITLASRDLTADLQLVLSENLGLSHAAITGDALLITEADGAQTSADHMLLTMDQADDAQTYNIQFTAKNLKPAQKHAKTLQKTRALPEFVETLQVTAQIQFDRPWDLDAIEAKRPQPRVIDLSVAEAKWGDIQIKLAGRVTVDAKGIPTGPVQIKAENWQTLLKAVKESGTVPKDTLKVIEGVLTFAARLYGSNESLDMPITFKKGLTFVGPIPAGPAPIIMLR